MAWEMLCTHGRKDAYRLARHLGMKARRRYTRRLVVRWLVKQSKFWDMIQWDGRNLSCRFPDKSSIGAIYK